MTATTSGWAPNWTPAARRWWAGAVGSGAVLSLLVVAALGCTTGGCRNWSPGRDRRSHLWGGRRLRCESWHLLHLYTYLGVGLALPHQLWTGGDFVASPAARAYWWTFYAVAAGSMLVVRLGLPAWRSATGPRSPA